MPFDWDADLLAPPTATEYTIPEPYTDPAAPFRPCRFRVDGSLVNRYTNSRGRVHEHGAWGGAHIASTEAGAGVHPRARLDAREPHSRPFVSGALPPHHPVLLLSNSHLLQDGLEFTSTHRVHEAGVLDGPDQPGGRSTSTGHWRDDQCTGL